MNDQAVTTIIEEFTVRKWANDEDRALDRPYEITKTTVTTQVNKETGEVISREQREDVLKPDAGARSDECAPIQTLEQESCESCHSPTPGETS